MNRSRQTATCLALALCCLLSSLQDGRAGSVLTQLEEAGVPPWAEEGAPQDDSQGMIDFPESAYIDPDTAPKVAEQPVEPGSGEETETEWGMGVNQREFKEEPRNTVVHCDGPECPYNKATLPGSRDFKGSYFPVQEIESDKALIEHLMKSLHKPCKACTLDQEEEANKKACESCRAEKTKKVKAVLEKVNKLRRENAAVVKEDKKQSKATGEQRRYTEPFNSTGTLSAPANTYLDLNELNCGVSKHTRSVCAMCGGGVAYRVRGYRLEVMAPREQRFVPSYPFAAVEELRRVRSVLKATAPASVTTMSLAGHGEVTCVASSPPPMVTDALLHLGVNLTAFGWTMLGMPSVAELGWTPTLTTRIDQRGRAEQAVPASMRKGGPQAKKGRVQSVAVMFAMARQPWGGATTIVPLLRLFDTVGEIEIWDPWGTDQGAEGTDAGSDAPLREVHQYINGSLMFGPVDVPVVATQPAMGAWGTVTGQVTRPVAVGHVLEGLDRKSVV